MGTYISGSLPDITRTNTENTTVYSLSWSVPTGATNIAVDLVFNGYAQRNSRRGYLMSASGANLGIYSNGSHTYRYSGSAGASGTAQFRFGASYNTSDPWYLFSDAHLVVTYTDPSPDPPPTPTEIDKDHLVHIREAGDGIALGRVCTQAGCQIAENFPVYIGSRTLKEYIQAVVNGSV